MNARNIRDYLQQFETTTANEKVINGMVKEGLVKTAKSAEYNVRKHCKQYKAFVGPELLEYINVEGRVFFRSLYLSPAGSPTSL